MMVLLNGAPLNGGASGIWAQGQSEAEALSSAQLRRTAYTAATAQVADAVQVTSADRTAWTAPVSVINEATVSVVAKRHAYASADVTTEALESGAADRTAWMLPSVAEPEGVAAATAVRERLAFSTITGESLAVDDDLMIVALRITRVRDTRGIALTGIDEGSIDRLLVNQVAATGTVIGRSGSTALANTQLGFSVITGEAGEVDDDLLVNIIRSAHGTSTAECVNVVDPSKVHISNGSVTGYAELYIAPDIIRSNGTVERHAWAIPVGEAVRSSVPGLAIRPSQPVPAVGECDGSQADGWFIRGVEGASEGWAAGYDELGLVRTNRWVQATGQSNGEAVLAGDGDRLVWVAASGLSYSAADSQSDSTRYRWKWVSPKAAVAEATTTAESRVFRPATAVSVGEPETTAVPFRLVKAESIQAAEGSVSAGSIVYHWVWMEGQSDAEGISDRAHAIRTVKGIPTKPIFGEAYLEKVYMMINVGEPAPDRRTIVVPETERLIVVAESTREMVI